LRLTNTAAGQQHRHIAPDSR